MTHLPGPTAMAAIMKLIGERIYIFVADLLRNSHWFVQYRIILYESLFELINQLYQPETHQAYNTSANNSQEDMSLSIVKQSNRRVATEFLVGDDVYFGIRCLLVDFTFGRLDWFPRLHCVFLSAFHMFKIVYKHWSSEFECELQTSVGFFVGVEELESQTVSPAWGKARNEILVGEGDGISRIIAVSELSDLFVKEYSI